MAVASRTISWQQLVQEADPDWLRKYQRYWIYEFSDGSHWDWRPDIYTTTGP